MVKIKFPDGNEKVFDSSVSGLDVARSISEGLARMAIAVKINGNLEDLTTTIGNDSSIEIITTKSPESLEILRHTTAHILAQAVLRLYPNAKISFGPSVENGFYYDIDCDEINDESLLKIEEEMSKIIKEDLEITKSFKTFDEAKEIFDGNDLKIEMLNDIVEKQGNSEKLQFYTQGEFSDVCRGPHLPKTGLVKAFKLEKVTKAYFKGDANRQQINRIYGTAFWKKSDVDDYFTMLEEAKKRDHRILGKQMDLFMYHEYAPGMTFFLPKGAIMYRELQNLIRTEYINREYKEVQTPNMFNKKLWETSGHWEHYKDDMFVLDIEGQEFSLKPMNCPSHCLIFKNSFKSYKELPLRIADFGAIHRNELSGALSGLTRVRKFCQDDAHIFCTMEQIEDEIDGVLDFVDYIYTNVFGMTYEIELSTRPEKYLGSLDVWNSAEESLANAIRRNGKDFEICEGDGAFYGPKIDFRIRDAIGRIWQTATIQLDFNLPERFELEYESEKNGLQRPVMVHRAILGSLERFMGTMIEHFAGKFPLWLNPTQIQVINVADRHQDYCEEIVSKLRQAGFRIDKSYQSEGVGKKIALARDKNKPNYMLVLGDNDVENNTVSVRTRKFENGKNEEFTCSFDEFLLKIIEERDKKLRINC